MGRATTKIDLMESANSNLKKLNTLIESMTEEERTNKFNFFNDEKKKEAHWRRDKNLKDVYIHLYEWHQLVVNWVNTNKKGEETPFLPAPYNWRTYGEMNIMFVKKHENTTLEESKSLFLNSHKEVLSLIETFTNDELFSKHMYSWVGGSTLGSYFVSSTTSHYDWAMKKIRAHIKNGKTNY